MAIEQSNMAQSAQRLTSPYTWNPEESRMVAAARDDRYLLVKGKAGLGNRMLCVMDSLLYAKLSNRKLCVDWRDMYQEHKGGDGTNAFPHLFSSPAVVPVEQLPPGATVAPETWQGRLDENADDIIASHYPDDPDADDRPHVARRFTTDTRRLHYHEQVQVRWAYVDELHWLRPHLRSHHRDLWPLSRYALLRRLMRDHLRPSVTVQRAFERVQEQLEGPSLGMHIRHTDKRNGFDAYPRLAERFLRRYPRGRLFLATDSQIVEAQMRQRFPNLVMQRKWYPQNGGALHREYDCPDRKHAATQALADLLALSRCSTLVFDSTSSFGLVAWLLGDGRQRTVDTAPLQARLREHAKQVYFRLQAARPVR